MSDGTQRAQARTRRIRVTGTLALVVALVLPTVGSGHRASADAPAAATRPGVLIDAPARPLVHGTPSVTWGGADLSGRASAAADHSGSGYNLFDDDPVSDGGTGLEFTRANPGYTIRLVAGPDIEALRSIAEATATRLAGITGQVVTVAPGTVPYLDSEGDLAPPGFGEIRIAESDAPGGQDQGIIGLGLPFADEADNGHFTSYAGYIFIYPSEFQAGVSDGERQAVLRHELGHVMGLAHITSSYGGSLQIMYPSVDSGIEDYQSGDQNGLKAVQDPGGGYIKQAYHDFLGRAPDAAGLGYWFTIASFADLGGRYGFVSQLTSSDEWLGKVVDGFYQSTLGRPGDTDGRAYWIGQLRKGMPVATAAGFFYGSQEYYDKTGGTDKTWVDALYTALLDRPADQSGESYWISQIPSLHLNGLSTVFFQSLESRLDRVRALYQTLLHRAPDGQGQRYWAGRVLNEGDLALAANLASSDEYFAAATSK